MNRYILFLIASSFFCIYTSVSANWYGTQWYGTSGMTTNCPSDGYTDSIFSPGPPPMAGGAPYYPAGQVRVVGSMTGWILCQKWDSTPPPSLFATNYSPTWKNTPINLNLYTLDEGGGSAISTSRYAWDGPCTSGMTFSFGAPLVQAINGEHTLYLCAWDNAGNSTLNHPISFYRFDNIKPPIVSATLSIPSTWRISPIVGITMTASDNIGGSGIKYAKYIWGTTASPPLESTCRASGLPITTTTQSTNGQNVLRICVEDNAGNQENWVGDYWLDAALPTALATPTSVAWTNMPITINLTANDTGGSSLTQSKYQWRRNNTGPIPSITSCLTGSGTSFTPTGQNIFLNSPMDQGRHTLYLCTQDGAGNQKMDIYANYEYDTTLPVVTANNTGTTWWTADYSATLFAHDPIPNIGVVVSNTTLATRRYVWDYNQVGPTPTLASCLASGTTFNSGAVVPITTEGDHRLYVCSRDLANNTGTLWVGQYRLDKQAPVASGLTYAFVATNGWTNNVNITLNWTATDNILSAPTIPSGLQNYDINVYRTSSQNNPTAANYLTTITTPTAASTYNYTGQDGYSYMFEVIPRDIAGNVGAVLTSTHIARIDTVNPVAATITTSAPPDLLATNNQVFNFGYNDGGAPVRIEYSFEQNGNPFGFDNLDTTIFAWTHNYNRDISTVDTDRGTNGGRQIDINITRICDQATNCIGPSALRTISHNVYANTTLASATSSATSITDGSAEADGSPHLFTMSVADTYGNQIVPATGILRTINIGLSSISNSMYLNQHARAGATSVYVTAPDNTPDDPLSFATTQSFASPITTVTTGDYPLAIKVYTPTASSYLPSEPASDNSANFGFDTNIIANDSLVGSRTFTQSIGAPIFRPLFTTDITGDLENGGFIEGTEQSSDISFTHNSGVNPSGTSLQLEFSGALASSFTLSGADITANMIPISTIADMAPSPIFSNTTLTTKLTQNPNITVNGTSDIQLSTHIKYVLDGKNVLYNSDIIGKIGGYWGGTTTQMGNQAGVKIIGAISSNNISSIVTNQFSTGTSIFDGVSRADVRNSVRRSVALAIRNAQLSPYSSTISTFTSLDPGADLMGTRIVKDANTSITYIKKNGGTVTLGSVAPVIGVSGRRTLVVEGADLYINRDLYYTSPDSILGVVVQKDANGVGGNLYIDPDITNIVGSYVIDGSVMSSSDGINPIGSSNIFSLKNQLYIHGSLVSENTIGGSRSYPLKCPSLIPPSLCNTTELAQRYDLNYLRRYYLYNGIPFGSGFGGTKVIGGGTCTSSCSGFGVLATKFTMPTDDLAKYPVIIEYNPAIRGNPPIGFEENAD